METRVKVKRADVARIVERTFPEYRGRSFHVMATEAVHIHGLNWSGGSRNEYRALSPDGRTGANPTMNALAPWDNRYEGTTVEIPAGYVVVEHCLFCGKDLGLRIYVNPSDMPRLLPQVAA